MVLILLSACATIGRYETADLEMALVAALPAESPVYLYVNPQPGIGLFEKVAELSDGWFEGVARLVENGDGIYAAVTVLASGPADWTLIALGNFPVGAYSAAMNLDRGWKRVSGAGRRWISTGLGFEIAFPSSQLVVAGSRNLEETVELLRKRPLPAGPPPGRFYDLISQDTRRGVVAYVVDAGDFLPLGLPPGFAAGCTATLTGDFIGDSLEAEMVLRFPTAATARVSGLAIRALTIAETKKGVSGMFADARVRVEDDSVTLGPILIEPGDVAGYLERALLKEGGTR